MLIVEPGFAFLECHTGVSLFWTLENVRVEKDINPLPVNGGALLYILSAPP